MTKLPRGWAWARLGDLCKPISNCDPRILDRPTFQYVDISAIEAGGSPGIRPRRLPVSNAPGRARKLMAAGDILFATVRPYLKKIGYATPALDGEIASTGFCVLRPVETVDSRYVYHYVQCDIFLNQILPKQRGVSYPAILDSDIFDSSIPLPPLAEQRRIVAALEDHLSRLDAGQSYVRQVTYQATKFSSSYLLGLLRETSRCSWSKLGDLAHDSCYGTSEKCSYDGNGIPVIRIPNVQSGQIELSDLKYTLQADLHLNNLMIRRGDILFIRSNGSRSLIGRAAVAKTNLDAAFASYLIRFRLNPELVNPQWVNAVVQSPPLQYEQRLNLSQHQAPDNTISTFRNLPGSRSRFLHHRCRRICSINSTKRLRAQVA